MNLCTYVLYVFIMYTMISYLVACGPASFATVTVLLVPNGSTFLIYKLLNMYLTISELLSYLINFGIVNFSGIIRGIMFPSAVVINFLLLSFRPTLGFGLGSLWSCSWSSTTSSLSSSSSFEELRYCFVFIKHKFYIFILPQWMDIHMFTTWSWRVVPYIIVV